MSKYVVGYINFFDAAESEKEAVLNSEFGLGYVFDEATTLEEAKNAAFEVEEMFDVIKVSEE